MVQSSDSCNDASLQSSDSCNDTRDATDAATQNKTVIVYCAAHTMQRIALLLRHSLDSTLNEIAPNNKIILKIIQNTVFFHQYSDECKDFTLAMSLYYQLQTYPDKQNSQINNKKLCLILTYLKMIANNLDEIQHSKQETCCARLTADGYKRMYHVLYKTTSLLTEIETQSISWAKNENYKKGAPPSLCILYPTK